MGVDEARGDRVGSSSAGCVGLTGPPHATRSAATNVAARAEIRFMVRSVASSGRPDNGRAT
jgi:hypothetical protein